MDEVDAVVVGGGPVGCRTAGIIAEAGFRTLVIEEHASIGNPVQCAGIVSPRVIELAPFKDCIQNEIRGANIHSPTGKVMRINARQAKAIVIDRALFDKAMAREAVKCGVEIQLGYKALGFSRASGRIETRYIQDSSAKTVSAKILIGADGMQGRVAKSFGFQRPGAFLYGLCAEASDTKIDGDTVEIFTGNGIAPGFFGWVIPLKNGDARLGLCMRRNDSSRESVSRYFKRFIALEAVSALGISESKLNRLMGGAIPIGAMKKTVADGVMLVGDAAAQAKPTSGGGIFTGLRCARHCGQAAAESIRKGDCSAKSLSAYEKSWRDELGGELRKGWLLHRIYSSLDDRRIEDAFEILNRPEIIRTIEEKGDLDFASDLARPLLHQAPALVKFAGPFLKSFL